MLHKVPIPGRPAGGRGKHAISFAVVLTMAAALGAGCGGSSGKAPKAAKSGGELVIGKPGEVDNLDPSVAIDGVAVDVIHMVYEGLVTLDGNKPIPLLAESWQETSPTTYVFKLRKGVKFSNGREVTVDDVVGSFNRLMDPKTASFWAGQVGIKRVEADGADQVKFTLTKPRSSFLAALSATNASVLPMKELAAKTYNPKTDGMLGTGPFKVVAHSQNESWRFARNPYYWRPGLPKVDKVFLRIMPDEAARMAALRNGSVDIATFEHTDSLRLLKGQANVKTTVQSTTDYYRLDVNAKSSIFRDDRLRQALALSIDRNKIQNIALGGVGRPTAAVSTAFGGICDPATLPFGTPNAQQAKSLVTAAGAAGKSVDIVSLPVIPMSPAIAQVIQRDLQATGLKVRIVSMEMGEAAKRIFSGGKVDFDASISWYAGYGDPAMALRWWNPELALFNKGFERSDAELDKLIEGSTETPPGPQRIQVMHDACARIAQNANVIPLVSKDTVIAYRSDKASVIIPQIEGYAVPLRRLAEFTAK
jgi:peptide/nickel transport system substrate-binding protein